MKFLAFLLGSIALVHSAAIIPTHTHDRDCDHRHEIVQSTGGLTQEKIVEPAAEQNYYYVKNSSPSVVQYGIVNLQSKKTNVVGPSGSITHEKYFQSLPVGKYNDIYGVVKNNPVTGKPVVVQYVEPTYGNVAVAQGSQVVSTPSEKTSVVGPSGSITQERYFQSTSSGKYNDIYGVVKNNPVTGKPVVVQYVEPTYGNVAVVQGSQVVSAPSEKTSVVGPSGSITQEKYLQSISSGKYNDIYGVVKNNPVTGKPVVVQYVEPTYGNVAVSQVSQVVNTPSEKTSVVGPSGSITQEKYLQSTSAGKYNDIYSVVKNNPVTGKPVVVQYVEPTYENVAVAQVSQVVNTPSEKTSVVGPSGSITQEKYLQSTSSVKNNDIYSVVKYNPVTGKPVVVQYVEPTYGNVAVSQVSQVVNTPSEKTSIVGPSGSITQEKYLQSTSAGKYNDIYSVVKNNPVTGKPVVVQYVEPTYENVAVAQVSQVVNTPSEKTSVVGPSGSITQEKYLQSTSAGKYNEIYGAVKINPVTGKPVVVQYVEPTYGNVAVVQGSHFVSTPSEKTSIVGSSGLITQEKYFQSTSDGKYKNIFFVKNNPFNGKQVAVQYFEPSYGKIAVDQGYHVVRTPSEKTSVLGPSGSITQEKYTPSNVLEEGYKFEDDTRVFPVNTYFSSPAVVRYGVSPTKQVAFVHGNDFYDTPVEKTSIVGPSGSIVKVNQFPPIGGEENTVKTSTYISSSLGVRDEVPAHDCDDSDGDHHHLEQSTGHESAFYYRLPYNDNVAIVSGNHFENTPVNYNTVNSDYLVQYGTAINKNLHLVYENHGLETPVVKTSIVGSNGATKHETISKIPQVIAAHDVHYPDIEKYPNIAAPDC